MDDWRLRIEVVLRGAGVRPWLSQFATDGALPESIPVVGNRLVTQFEPTRVDHTSVTMRVYVRKLVSGPLEATLLTTDALMSLPGWQLLRETGLSVVTDPPELLAPERGNL